MDGQKSNKTRTNLSGVNAHLNYRRKFVSPERVLITIPSIPFQSFDLFLPGFKVKPWELLNLMISARSFSQWPALNAEQPNDSIIDSHLLMEDNFVFIVAVKMDIAKQFHDPYSPKFPLIIDANVTHVGSGSSRRRYVMSQPDDTSPYITCDIDDVLICKRNRRPTTYPDWWSTKFGYINRIPKEKFRVSARTTEKVFKSECTVEYIHIDHNKHTTFSAYVLFCFNALFNNLTVGRARIYNSISFKHFQEGVKTMTMIFHKESNIGDKLVVESWQPSDSANSVNFHVKKQDDTHCSSICIEFYEPKDDSSKL